MGGCLYYFHIYINKYIPIILKNIDFYEKKQ